MVASKNILFKAKRENEIFDVFARTTANNVIVDKATGETLKQRLLAISKQLVAASPDTGVAEQVAEVKAQVETVKNQVSALIADAPEAYDTLKEIADWINAHQTEYQELSKLVAGIDAAIAAKVGDLGEHATVKDFVEAKVAEEAARAQQSETSLQENISKIFVLFNSEEELKASGFNGLAAVILPDDPVEVGTEAELVAAAAGENKNIMLTNDIELSQDINLKGKSVDSGSNVINANGHTVNV